VTGAERSKIGSKLLQSLRLETGQTRTTIASQTFIPGRIQERGKYKTRRKTKKIPPKPSEDKARSSGQKKIQLYGR
ncbi:hypothetical protein J6590_094842, partial [Homalodisca vitripennis]